jgi:dynein heavy chain
LATLSAHISNYQVLNVDTTQWEEEMQKILKIAGVEQKKCIFIFSDSQHSKETLYDDISNLLNNGEIPNLYPADEKTKIVEEISNIMPNGT